jgi:hypothetical protein
MARTSQYSTDMPGIYTPSPSRVQTTPSASYIDAAPRFSFASETSGQLTEHETRKRSRHDHTSQPSTAGSWNDNSLGFSRFTDTRSPPPLAYDRYQLADGGMERSPRFGRQAGDYDDYFQLQKQRGQWSVPPTPYTGLKQMAMEEMQTTPNGTKAWSFMGLVGGVAGKLFQFCTVPFRGFQAGGGQTYTVDSQAEIAARLGLQDDPYSQYTPGPVQHIAPGGFPQDDYGVKSIDSLNIETPERPRMTKRLRTADNWVVVDRWSRDQEHRGCRSEGSLISRDHHHIYPVLPRELARQLLRSEDLPSFLYHGDRPWTSGLSMEVPKQHRHRTTGSDHITD